MAEHSTSSNKVKSFHLGELEGVDTAHIIATPDGYIIGMNPERLVSSWEDVQSLYTEYWLLGYCGYEFGYTTIDPPANSVIHTAKHDSVTLPNIQFGAYSTVLHIDTLEWDDAVPPTLQWSASMDKAEYNAAFATIQEHIKNGNVYQANLSYRMAAEYTESAAKIFAHLVERYQATYSAYIHTPEYSIISSSPELLCAVRGTTITTHPMKGTRLRPRNTRASRGLPTRPHKVQDELKNSVKDKAELDMIIDVHRNDLARTAQAGSVQVVEPRRIRALHTVWQADAVITAELAKPHTALDTFTALFPAGSITGAPKLRAMEILHALEPTRRNIYCGSIGYCNPNGDIQFNVAIRTAYQLHNMLYYHVGGGIVFDSEVEQEFNETRWKAYL